MRKSKVLAKLRNNECVISIGISFTSSSRVTELAGKVGFDCLWIDMEHRPFDYDDVFHLIQGARAADTDCVVRIRKECEANYFRPLEDGAAGIMVPDCRSAEEAREIIKHCKYPPMGSRGIDGVGPDADYGMIGAKEYMQHANHETFVIVQIEERETVKRVDEIAAVEGVDILFIGPGDLTKSYGILGETKNPIFMEAVKKVAEAAARHGIWWGLPAGNLETAQMYIDMGARFINCTSDRAVLLKGLTDIKAAYSSLIVKRKMRDLRKFKLGKESFPVCGDHLDEAGKLFYTWPSLTKCTDGSVLCCMREGTGKNSPDGRIRLFVSLDNGENWMESTSPINNDRKGNPDCEYRNCSITSLEDGRLIAIFMRIHRPDGQDLFDPEDDGILPQDFFIIFSEDRGTTWKDQQPIDISIDHYSGIAMIDDGCTSLPDGSLILPAETWRVPGKKFENGDTQQARVNISRDCGLTWKESYINAHDPSGVICYYDQRLCYLESGRLISLIWTHNYMEKVDLNIHMVFSDDGGKTWSLPKDTGLNGQIAAAADAGDGKILCVYNCRKGRQGVKAVLSYDKGMTWDTENEITLWDQEDKTGKQCENTQSMTFEAISGFLFGHPDIVKLSDGNFLAGYYCSNKKNTFIEVSSIKLMS